MARLAITRGDDISINITVINDDSTVVDITGWTVFLTVKATTVTDDDSTAVIQKTVTSHTDPTNGKTAIPLAASDTYSVTPGTYYYDIQFKDASGTIQSSSYDYFVIAPDITRRIA